MFLQRPVNHLKGKGCDKCGGTSDLTVEKLLQQREQELQKLTGNKPAMKY